MRGKVKEHLLTSEEIQERVRELGQQISADYGDEPLFAICLLKGSIIFAADLVRHITTPLQMDVMRASSYGGDTKSSGNVKILVDLDTDITDKHVLIIEDIVDTGRTLKKIIELLEVRHPKSLKVASLLDKPSRRVVSVPIDYVGFVIEDHFVVGYGLDFDEHYRELPYVGILDPNG